MNLEGLIIHVPRLLQLLPPDTLEVLRRTNRNLRLQVESIVSTITIHDSDFVFLLATRQWPSLQHLDLGYSNLHSEGMAALCGCECPRMKTLRLSQCNLDSERIAYLVTASWPNLEFLDLSSNQLVPADLARLCTGKWPQLRKLDLSSVLINQNLNNPRLRDDADSMCMDDFSQAEWPNMSHLRLFGCQVREVGMKSLICCQWSRMQELYISSQTLHTSDFHQLSQAHWPLLQVLSLSNTKLNEQGMTEVIKGDWPKLACLDVSYNYDDSEPYGSHWVGFDTATTKVLAQGKWPLLEKLNMHCNFLNAVGMSELVKGDWPLLKVLDVDCYGLNAASVHVLVSGRGVFPLLERLQLTDLSKQYREDGLFGELLAHGFLLDTENYATRARLTTSTSWPHLQQLYFGQLEFTRFPSPEEWFDEWDYSLVQGTPGVCQSRQ